MEKVKVENAVGHIVSHDMTRIVAGSVKEVAFPKGHIIKESDIPLLKSMGKENVYIGCISEGSVHEEEAALRIATAAFSQDDFQISTLSEGKVNLLSKHDGIFCVDVEKLNFINEIDHVTLCTIYNNTPVSKGQKVASTRIIPLFTDEKNIEQVEKLCNEHQIFKLMRYIPQSVHMLITGSEIHNGIIKDKSYDIINPKVLALNSNISRKVIVRDDKELLKREIQLSIEEGADIIICVGGMSVDADDVTPLAIGEIADEVVTQGTPIQPGNMFLLAYNKDTPILGLPAGTIFFKTTVFDVVFPLIACKNRLTEKFFIKLSHGGLCHFCKVCKYPNCTYGKGAF